MKNEISDFLKFAKEKGKIKDLEEAFNEFPVEEEWHKGKIENLSCVNEEEEILALIILVILLLDRQILFKIGEVDRDKVEEYKKSFLQQ